MGKPDLRSQLRQLAKLFDYELIDREHSLSFEDARSRIQPRFELLGADEVFVYFYVRTTSWDFSGERTDIHDVLSFFSAMFLRNVGVSARLWDVPNKFSRIPTELYARYLTLDQPRRSMYRLDPQGCQQLSEILAAVRVFDVRCRQLFQWEPNLDPHTEDTFSFNDRATRAWAAKVARVMGDHADGAKVQYNRRKNPHLLYYRNVGRQVSVFRSSVLAKRMGAFVIARQEIERMPAVTGDVFVSNESRNFVSHTTSQRIAGVMKRLEPRRRALCLMLPIDSHIMAVGVEHVLAVRHECGRVFFDSEVERLRDRRLEEDRVFFPGTTFTWAQNIRDERFEELVRDLLAVEPGVHWIRKVGPTREPDEGRDLVCEWTTLLRVGEVVQDEMPPSATRRVIVQCKALRSSVGKSHVQDVHDTVHRHGCTGYFLAVSSQLTVSLTRFMEGLRNSTDLWADWWTRSEIEDRLRRYPEIATRYGDVVRRNDVGTDSTQDAK
jgi:Restriction endonuclease